MSRTEVRLEDKYRLESGRAFLTGVEALAEAAPYLDAHRYLGRPA